MCINKNNILNKIKKNQNKNHKRKKLKNLYNKRMIRTNKIIITQIKRIIITD